MRKSSFRRLVEADVGSLACTIQPFEMQAAPREHGVVLFQKQMPRFVPEKASTNMESELSSLWQLFHN
jgi:hypothetical protein